MEVQGWGGHGCAPASPCCFRPSQAPHQAWPALVLWAMVDWGQRLHLQCLRNAQAGLGDRASTLRWILSAPSFSECLLVNAMTSKSSCLRYFGWVSSINDWLLYHSRHHSLQYGQLHFIITQVYCLVFSHHSEVVEIFLHISDCILCFFSLHGSKIILGWPLPQQPLLPVSWALMWVIPPCRYRQHTVTSSFGRWLNPHLREVEGI